MKYEGYIRSKSFKEDVNKIKFLVAAKKWTELENFKGLQIEDLHNIYLYEWCQTRKCHFIFGGVNPSDLREIEKGKQSVKSLYATKSTALSQYYTNSESVHSKSVDQIKTEHFVEKLMEKISPKFSVLPQPLDKTIVGFVRPENEDNVAKEWKGKFKSIYNHRILEIDECDEAEETKVIIEQNKTYD